MVWWEKDDAFDQEIKSKFGDLHLLATQELLDDWQTQPKGALALVIVLDQFSRNLYRGLPAMYDQDSKALWVAKNTIDSGMVKQLSPVEQVFLYMPFEHSENLNDQKVCVAFFKHLLEQSNQAQKELAQFYLKFAEEHHDIVAQFGRFPHRNAILARKSTPEEANFLQHHKGF